ncbi:MAG TPA: Flp family type IVb pilin [Candidatus Dormibacteraeota bacterium]|jgi:pilus assembly protein Flp/PilA|nr:Flp family type IVb pilin [Candidatus Dormibacteraeota bacterium]
MPAADVVVDDGVESVALSMARRRGQRGQGMVEYAFILVLVAVVVLVSVMVLGKTTGNLYSNVSTGLGN